MTDNQFIEIKRGFIAALYFFSSWADEVEDDPEISGEALEEIDTMVINFVDSVGGVEYLLSLPDQYHPDLGSHLAGVGCDLWHTISGSGVGFWESDYGEFGDYLTEKAESVCSHFETYIGNNGLIYIC